MLNLNVNRYLEWIKTDEGKNFIDNWKQQSNNNNNLNKNEVRNRNNYLN